eukprot:12563-Heterococcus_DN1.PRE.4
MTVYLPVYYPKKLIASTLRIDLQQKEGLWTMEQTCCSDSVAAATAAAAVLVQLCSAITCHSCCAAVCFYSSASASASNIPVLNPITWQSFNNSNIR